MRVHINEIKGQKAGYKIRWTEDGKPKEAFRKEYKDAVALQASVRERFIGDSNEEYRKTHLSDPQLKDAEAALLQLHGRLSLREASRLALEHWVDASSGICIVEARWRFSESLESEGLRPETVTKYKQTARRIASGLEGKRTSDLTHECVRSLMGLF